MPLNLGDIQFALGANTAGLDRAAQKLVDFSKQVDSAAKKQGEGADKVAAAYKKQETAIASALKAALNLNAAVIRAGAPASVMDTASTAVNNYTNSLTRGAVSALAFQRANTRLSAAMAASNRTLANIKAGQTPEGASAFQKGLESLKTAAVLTMGPLGGVASRLGALGTVMGETGDKAAIMLVGFGTAAFALDKLSKKVIEAANQVDALKVRFEAISGSPAGGEAAFNDLAAAADHAGIRIQDLGPSFSNFMLAVKNTSLEGQNGAKAFNTVADALGRMHADSSQTAGAFTVLTQMLDGTAVKTQQLRGLVNDLGIGFRQIATANHLDPVGFNEMIKSGRLLGEDIIPMIAKTLREVYHLDGSSVNTYEASIARLHNANLNFLASLDKVTGISNTTKTTIDLVTRAINALGSSLEEVGPKFGALLAGVTVGGALTVTLIALRAGVIALAGAFGLAETGVVALLATSPVGWFIAILGAATAAWYAVEGYTHAQDELAKSTADADKNMDDFIGSLHGGASMVGQANLKQQADAVTEAADQIKKAQAEVDEASSKPVGAHWGWTGLEFTPQSFHDEDVAKAKDKLAAATAHYNDELDRQSRLQTALSKTGQHGVGTYDNKKDLEAQQKAADEITRLHADTSALISGGIQGYDATKQLNEVNLKVDAFRKLLDQGKMSTEEANERLLEYKVSLELFDQTLKKAQVDQAGFKAVTDTATKAIGTVSDAFERWTQSGNRSMSGFRDFMKQAIAEVLTDIEKLILKLGVINPIINSIFGPTDNGNLLPELFRGGLSGNGTAGSFGGSGGSSGIAGILGGAGGGILGALGGGVASLFGWGGNASVGSDVAVQAAGGNSFGAFDNIPLSDDAFSSFLDGITFGTGGSMDPSGGIVGDKGPEWFSPGTSGTVVSSAQLQRQMAANDDGDGSPQIVIHMPIQTGVAPTVQAEINRLLPSIKQNVMAGVMNARLRGGKFANAFGAGQ